MKGGKARAANLTPAQRRAAAKKAAAAMAAGVSERSWEIGAIGKLVDDVEAAAPRARSV